MSSECIFLLNTRSEALMDLVSAPLVTVASGKVRLYKDSIGWPKP